MKKLIVIAGSNLLLAFLLMAFGVANTFWGRFAMLVLPFCLLAAVPSRVFGSRAQGRS